jgi:phosphoribosylanthranilate isomerase
VVAKIKFCGMIQGQDAVVAAEAGPAYLGVVFAEGLRAVTVQGAKHVVGPMKSSGVRACM